MDIYEATTPASHVMDIGDTRKCRILRDIMVAHFWKEEWRTSEGVDFELLEEE